jgi:hypothetical protein
MTPIVRCRESRRAMTGCRPLANVHERPIWGVSGHRSGSCSGAPDMAHVSSLELRPHRTGGRAHLISQSLAEKPAHVAIRSARAPESLRVV